jgi:uncharacterized membrane protein YhaH (DUF805 family)
MNKKFNNTLGDALREYWVNYIGWGRATRSEYWWAVLFYGVITGNVLGMLSSTLQSLWSLIILVPSFCLAVRRLHDTGRSAWNYLWVLLPVIGWIVLIIFLCQKGSTTKNKYGPARLKK